MRKHLKYILLFALPLFSCSVHAGILPVTGCNNQASANAITCTMNTTVGQVVIAGGETNSGTATMVMSSSGTGDTWTSAQAGCSASGNQNIQMFWMIPTNSTTSDVITLTGTGAVYVILGAESFSGATISNPIDGSGACVIGSSTTPATGSYAVTTGDYNIGWVLCQGAATVGAGWSDLQNATYSDLEGQTAASGSANATWTSTTGNWAAEGIAIKPAGGGAPPCFDCPIVF